MEEWNRYFDELLNRIEEENIIEKQTSGEDEIIISRPMKEEVKSIIKELKSNKNPGANKISAEMLQEESNYRKNYST